MEPDTAYPVRKGVPIDKRALLGQKSDKELELELHERIEVFNEKYLNKDCADPAYNAVWIGWTYNVSEKAIKDRIIAKIINSRYLRNIYTFVEKIFHTSDFYKARNYYLIYGFVNVVCNYSNSSEEIRTAAIKLGIVSLMNDVLENIPIDGKQTVNWKYERKSILEGIFSILLNLTKAEKYRKFDDLNLENVAKFKKEDQGEKNNTLVYMVLAMLITNDEKDMIDDAGDVTKTIIDRLRRSLQNEEHIDRGISSTDYLNALYRMTMSEKLLTDIIKLGIIGPIYEEKKNVLLFPHEKNDDFFGELIYAIYILHQMTFCENGTKVIKQSKDLFNVIKEIRQKKYSETINFLCNGILRLCKERANVDANKDESEGSKDYVMISYCHEVQSDVLKIYQILIHLNYKVWIDKFDMSGNTLDSMSEAVENCKLFLLCASEGYSTSPACKQEANYANRLKKPFLYVRMTSTRYGGWLELLLSSELYIKYWKSDFAEKIARLMKDKIEHQPILSDHTGEIKKSMRNWTSIEVTNWFASNQLTKYYNLLANKVPRSFEFDGAILYEIRELILNNPQPILDLLGKDLTILEKLKLFSLLRSLV
ncbi:hypothetical protein SNEBB_001247 [Seison nebaliae]|nr:hypothetical protein SNEBB_001247 [Seison nebaliae]